MNSEEYFNVISHVKTFPTIPAVYHTLNAMLEDPETDIEKISSVIMLDPVLTSKLIKIANSSFFGFREKVTSIQKAVSLLGLNLVKNLVLSTSILSSFTGTKKNVDRTQLWRHSIGVAVASKFIGKDYSLSIAQSEELYTIGLLHDIGKIVTEQYFPKQYDEIINLLESNPSLFFWQAEQKVIGLTHAETGSLVVRNWNFEHKIVSVIQYHHAIDAGFEFITERERLFLSIIHLADYLIKRLNYGNNNKLSIEPLNLKVIGFLELKSTRIENYYIALQNIINNIDDFLLAHF